ncbi:hypothetical protein EVAR_92582_1 [Eumeta japonica]|uniref:Uncharacterized protein n=1 Tax=Eumeta variegata TaxID=151549 RepID=A0A4C1SWH5_EUMVA|nr:hypothetical protein EVAR_92582_1 [Eumeta japonica]
MKERIEDSFASQLKPPRAGRFYLRRFRAAPRRAGRRCWPSALFTALLRPLVVLTASITPQNNNIPP